MRLAVETGNEAGSTCIYSTTTVYILQRILKKANCRKCSTALLFLYSCSLWTITELIRNCYDDNFTTALERHQNM